jgi:hypothetical protein
MWHLTYSIIARNYSNEIVEYVCGSVSVGVVLPDTDFISCVDPRSISLDTDPSFVELGFMLKYEASFWDERAEDSADDRPVPELSKRDKSLLQQVLVEHAPEIPNCRDLSQAHRAVLGGRMCCPVVCKLHMRQTFFPHLQIFI